jgi:hypothetical protein
VDINSCLRAADVRHFFRNSLDDHHSFEIDVGMGLSECGFLHAHAK